MKKLLILLLCVLGFTHVSHAGAQTLGEYAIQDSSLRNACPTDLNGMIADWFRSQGLPFTVETGRVYNTVTRETVYKSGLISAKLPFWDGRAFSVEIGVLEKVVPTRVMVYIPDNSVNSAIGNEGDSLAEDLARTSLQPFLRQRAKAYTQPCADSSAYVPAIGFDSQVRVPGQILADFTNLKGCQDALRELETFAFAGVQYGELGGCNVLASTSGQGSNVNIQQFEDALRSLGYAQRVNYQTGAAGVTVKGWQQGEKAFIIELGAYQPDPRATLLVWRSATFKPSSFVFDGRVAAPFDALFLGDNPGCVSRQTQLREALSAPEKSAYTLDGGCLTMTGTPQGIYTQTRAALENADYEISEDFSGYASANNTALIYAARAGTGRGLQLVIQSLQGGVLMTWMGVKVNQAVTATRAPFAFDLSVRISAPSYHVLAQCEDNLKQLRDAVKLESGSSYAQEGGCIIISAPYPQMVSVARQAFAAAGYREEFQQVSAAESFFEMQRGGSSDSYLLNVLPFTQYGAVETVILWVKINSSQAPKKSGSSVKPTPINRSSPSASSFNQSVSDAHRRAQSGESTPVSALEFEWTTDFGPVSRDAGHAIAFGAPETTPSSADSRRRRTLF